MYQKVTRVRRQEPPSFSLLLLTFPPEDFVCQLEIEISSPVPYASKCQEGSRSRFLRRFRSHLAGSLSKADSELGPTWNRLKNRLPLLNLDAGSSAAAKNALKFSSLHADTPCCCRPLPIKNFTARSFLRKQFGRGRNLFCRELFRNRLGEIIFLSFFCSTTNLNAC